MRGPDLPLIARLREWAERLCDAAAGDRANILAALALAGPVRPAAGEDLRIVDGLPAGVAELDLDYRADRLWSVSVRLGGAGLTRADFDAWFGPGDALPRIHWDSDHVLSYRVEVPGAASSCTVFPRFGTEPGAATVTRQVSLRRDRP